MTSQVGSRMRSAGGAVQLELFAGGAMRVLENRRGASTTDAVLAPLISLALRQRHFRVLGELIHLRLRWRQAGLRYDD